MSFDNNYPNRKDWRKPYRKSKAFDRTCRPGGDCSYCRSQRLYSKLKRLTHAVDDIVAFQLGDYQCEDYSHHH